MAIIRTALLVLLVVCGFTASAQIQKPSSWESALYTDHPLVGRIWHSAANRYIDVEELAQRIESASYLLLGEKHDNPDHHDLQLMVMNQLIDRDRLALAAFEMMDSDDQARLDSIAQQDSMGLSALKAYLEWDEEGWDWNFYGQLIQAVYRAAIPMAAANITNATVGRVYGEPTPADITAILDVGTMEQLNLDIDESHCGLLPESQFPAMVRVQQVRDMSMARSLQGPPSNGTAVLIAGNYHIRQDLGVPNYLLAENEGLQRSDILALSFMEVQPEEEDPAAYLQQFGPERAFDVIWFTPAISDEDYCASLQQR